MRLGIILFYDINTQTWLPRLSIFESKTKKYKNIGIEKKYFTGLSFGMQTLYKHLTKSETMLQPLFWILSDLTQ